MHRFAPGPFNASYESRVDWRALRSQRVDHAAHACAEAGLDGLLVFKDENIRYLTDLRPQIIAGKSTSLNGALLVAGSAPVLLVSGGELDRVCETMPWIEEVHVMPILEQKSLIEGFIANTLAPLLAEKGLANARLGLDAAPTRFHLALASELPGIALGDGDTPMQQARRIKFASELVAIEEATAIADAVTDAACRTVSPGLREQDVAAEGMATLFRLGGEYAHVMTPFVASGEHMSPPHRITTDKIIRDGDLVFVDIGACWGGYFGDVARSVICGSPSERQKEIYTAVYDSLHEGIAAMRAGNTERDAVAAFHRGARKHKLEDRFLTLFIGHGCGMGANEPPYIGETLPGAATYEFEPGMVFAVEPLIWVPGIRGGGGVRLEEMVLITAGDPHVLSRAPFDDRLLTDA